MTTAIIIITYYTGEILFDCLKAALLTNTEEIIIINNGNPQEVIIRLKSLDPRAKIITGHGNIGFGAGCNLGARNTNCENLLFLNPDAVLQNDAYTNIIKSLNPKTLIGGIIIDEKGKELRGSRRGELSLKSFFNLKSFNLEHQEFPNKLIEIPTISGAFFAVKAKDFNAINGFDEGYFLHVEDIDLCKRFRAYGKIYINPFAKAIHIGSTSKSPKLIIEYYKFKGFIRYLWKFENKFLTILFAPLLALMMLFKYVLKV